jgi:hypothetical protein
MPLLLRNIRSGKRKALLTELPSIAKEMLSAALDKQIKPLLVKSHNLVVANWKNKPEFQTRKYIKSDSIRMTVYPTGEAKEIYGYVDQGTKPHLIVPVHAKLLKFKTGYISKTLARPARTVPGGGKATGPQVFAKVVHHPGSEPREFSKAIAGDIQPDFNRIIDNTFRAIARKLEE